ncbi:MAG: methyltransferase domain-containing protein [Crocinitomix sp.]|nr:methyltransferase domain-containing protein [Crocinitomix sp.]
MEDIKGTDVYLLDQIMKGRYLPTDKILDAGCGSGRNMRWFALNNYHIYGCDLNVDAVVYAQEITGLEADKFKVSAVEKMPYANGEFDHVICNAVLHFAENDSHFIEMANDMFRVLKPGGTLFVRMTSTFGLPQNYIVIRDGRYLLADGSERFLLTKELLTKVKTIGFDQIEPVKSVLVEELRSMTTLVLRKIG